MPDRDRYDAFVSYSHHQDRVIARALQVELQGFARPWYKARALRVFRDEASLSASPHLWSEIERALRSSEWFILMASPLSAHSRWVNREVAWWKEHRSIDRMLLALTDGEIAWAGGDFDWSRTSAVPTQLARSFTQEPLWVDLRGLRPAAEVPDDGVVRLGDMVAEFAAPIHRRDKDTLVGEHNRLGRRIKRAVVGAVAGLVVLFLLAAAAAVFANDQRLEAVDQARRATARQLAATSQAFAGNRLDLAQLLAVEAYRTDPNPVTRAALFQAVTASPALVRFLPADAAVSDVAGSADGRVVAAGTATGRVFTWTHGGARVEVGVLDRSVTALAISADGTTVAATDGSAVMVWSAGKGTSVPVPGNVVALALSPSGHRLVAGTSPDLRVSADQTPQELVHHDRDTNRTIRVAVDINPSLLAFRTDDELVAAAPGGVWQRRSGPDLSQVNGTGQASTGTHSFAATISANGAYFGYSNGGRAIPVWSTTNLANDHENQDLVGQSHGTNIEALAISSTGRHIAVADAGTIYVGEATPSGSGAADPAVLSGNGTVNDLAFYGDDRHLVSASGSTVALWDLNQAARIARRSDITVDSGCSACSAPAVKLSPNGRFVAVEDGNDNAVTVGRLRPTDDVSGGEPLGAYRFLGWSQHGDRLYVVTSEGTVAARAPDAPAQDLLPATTPDHRTVAVSVDGTRLVEVGPTGDLLVRAASDGAILHRLAGDIERHERLIVSADARTLVRLDDRDRDVHVVRLTDGTDRTVGDGPARQVTLTPEYLLIQRASGALEIWDPSGAKLIRSIQQDRSYQPSGAIVQTAPTAGRGLLVQQRSDAALAVTDLSTGDPLGYLGLPVEAARSKTGLAMSADGRQLVTVSEADSSGKGVLLQWDLTPESWIAAACDTAGRNLTAAEADRYLGQDDPPACGGKPARSAGQPAQGQDPTVQATRLGQVMQQMSAQRSAVQKAVRDAQTCAGFLDDHVSALRTAAMGRNRLANLLANVPTNALPDGERLTRLLTLALRHSAAADEEFASWAADLSTGGCRPGQTTTSYHYANAMAHSQQATSTKQNLARLWNTIAGSHHLRTWQEHEL